jgi:large subunit ribosomal protein L3
MLPYWDGNGIYRCLTVLHVDNNHVIQVKRLANNASPLKGLSEWSVQIGAGFMRPYQAKKPHRYHCAYAGTDVKEKLVEFRVAPAAAACVQPGTPITARHFIPGQYLDITGTSIGKGFQGAMKRHGFAGLPASHGVSLTHRSVGATGQRQDPGRVFKGKRMPGRMGGLRKTVQNLRLERLDRSRNLLFVSGPVPGHAGNWVLVRDAVKRSGLEWWSDLPRLPPFPTYIADTESAAEDEPPMDWFAAPRRHTWINENLSNEAT